MFQGVPGKLGWMQCRALAHGVGMSKAPEQTHDSSIRESNEYFPDAHLVLKPEGKTRVLMLRMHKEYRQILNDRTYRTRVPPECGFQVQLHLHIHRSESE